MSIEDFLEAYDNAGCNINYPPAFLDKYIMLECLAERSGIDTFLVQDQEAVKYIAKCYDKGLWNIDKDNDVLSGVDHAGFPKQVDVFENDEMCVVIRDYIEGESLDRYALENDLSINDIVKICEQLCDVLSILHHRDKPIIHRDIKPSNIIVKSDGSIALIDFDIARIWHSGNDTDTYFFGTVAYAPPEQYGFSQTDARTDIYSLGILLRYLLTGSTRENKNIRLYRPLQKIINKCTAFSPKERYGDVDQVKRAFMSANPRSQTIKLIRNICAVVIVVGLLSFGGVKIYQRITYNPFNDESIPGALNDEERIDDAIHYMKDKYGTALFDVPSDEYATMGCVRQALIEIYGLDKDYVYAYQSEGELPEEGPDYFFPWELDDGQTVRRDTMVYTAVKVHDPARVADWSELKDDNGEYPGERVAVAFAEKTGILTGANRPYDITIGEMALILANTDRVFEAAD